MVMDKFDIRIRERFSAVEYEREALHSYQRDIAIPFLKENPFSALFIGLGMGKTICSLTVIADMLADMEIKRKVLVVAPIRVMTDTWPTEIRAWRHTAWINHIVIRVSDDDPRLKRARKRAREQYKAKGLAGKELATMIAASESFERELIMSDLARSDATVHLVNFERLEWLVNLHGPKWPYRTVFIDESSKLKAHGTHRFKALAKVRRTPGLITRLHELTATPNAESYEHLFAQLYLLDLGKRLGTNITEYRKTYFTQNQYSMKWELRPGGEDQIIDKIKDVCLVMEAKDYLQQKEAIVLRRPVVLEDSVVDLYRTMERNFIATLADGTEIEAETAANLSNKLSQIASGFIYEKRLVENEDTGDFEEHRKVHMIHDAKIEALREIIDEHQGKPILVAYHFKPSLDRLKKAFPQGVQMDKEARLRKPWNEGKIPLMFMHPKSGGYGLNMQKGGHLIVFFDLDWPYEPFDQYIGRLARQGQLNQVMVFLLTSMGTIDEEVCDALRAKEDRQDDFFARLKRKVTEFRRRREEQRQRDRVPCFT